MAHLYVVCRGILKDLRQWELDLSSVFTKFRFKHPSQFNVKDAPIVDGIVRTSVRPVQLYEIVFPEENLKEILGVIMPMGEIPYSVTEGQDKKRKKEHGLMIRYTNYLRKLLHLEKIPDKWEKTRIPMTDIINSNDVGVHPIGFKKDRRDIDGIEEL